MDLERRARQRDKTDVFADESEALDQIAKQVNEATSMGYYCVFHCHDKCALESFWHILVAQITYIEFLHVLFLFSLELIDPDTLGFIFNIHGCYSIISRI